MILASLLSSPLYSTQLGKITTFNEINNEIVSILKAKSLYIIKILNAWDSIIPKIKTGDLISKEKTT